MKVNFTTRLELLELGIIRESYELFEIVCYSDGDVSVEPYDYGVGSVRDIVGRMAVSARSQGIVSYRLVAHFPGCGKWFETLASFGKD